MGELVLSDVPHLADVPHLRGDMRQQQIEIRICPPTNKFVGYCSTFSNFQIVLWIPTFVGMTANLSYETTSFFSCTML